MIRVRRNRCGYNGYACASETVPDVSGVFATTAMHDDPLVDNIEPDLLIDNYLNLPTKVRGMVVTVDHILDMDDAELRAQEKLCEREPELMPNIHQALMDMVDYRMSWQVNEGMERVRKYTRLVDRLPHCTRLMMYEDTPPKEDEYTLDPGILEPMMQTPASPVGIDCTAFNMNSVMIVLVQLAKWRIEVDKKLRLLIQATTHLLGLRNLLIAAQKEALCECFKIRLTSGDPIQWGTKIGKSPTYAIDGCTIKLNCTNRSVPGKSNLKNAPFYLYLNVYRRGNNDIADLEVRIEQKRGGDYSLGLGGVKKVVADSKKYICKRGSGGDGETPGTMDRDECGGENYNPDDAFENPGVKTDICKVPAYVMYQIVQERCSASISLTITNKKGLLEWNSGAATKVYETADCDEG